jgi:hypothetical protein
MFDCDFAHAVGREDHTRVGTARETLRCAEVLEGAPLPTLHAVAAYSPSGAMMDLASTPCRASGRNYNAIH